MELFTVIDFSMVVIGILGIYNAYQLRTRQHIGFQAFFYKNMDMKNCKDVKGFCKEMSQIMFVFFALILVSGLINLYSTFVQSLGIVATATTFIMVFACFAYAANIRKMALKYFYM